MKTKQPATELHSSYQAMVDSIEEFMVKEGKTLQQAFCAAEEKLNDAQEISKEKIQQASSGLKVNLRLLAEAVEGVTESYKEQIRFDLAYVNNSIWGKLQNIANSNTADLMAFTRDLREKAQTVTTEVHLAAHQEHNQWSSERALWLDEVDFWRKDHDQALSKLEEIEKALKQQSRALFKHAQSIRKHAETEHEHEKSMTNEEQDLSSKVFEVADENKTKVHQKERQIQAQQLELHHDLKTQHFKLMAMINMLYKEIHKAS